MNHNTIIIKSYAIIKRLSSTKITQFDRMIRIKPMVGELPIDPSSKKSTNNSDNSGSGRNKKNREIGIKYDGNDPRHSIIRKLNQINGSGSSSSNYDGSGSGSGSGGWRGLPNYIAEARDHICQNKDTDNLRRHLKYWMISPDDKKYRYYKNLPISSSGGGGGSGSGSGSGSGIGSEYIYNQPEVKAYTHFIFPDKFNIVRNVLNEISGRCSVV